MKYVVYLRESDVNQYKASIEKQEREISFFLENFTTESYSIVKFFFDETEALANSLYDRPVLKNAVFLAKKENATLLFSTFDRLSLSPQLSENLIKNGIKLKAAMAPMIGENIIESAIFIQTSIARQEFLFKKLVERS